MLILLVATALIGSLVVEMLVHRFNSAYEIEWPVAAVAPENAMALRTITLLNNWTDAFGK